jgi:DNA repair protein RecN (Recombination protein N)
MLEHVHIENFAIIDDLELDINSGMTVLTGETGAGKSIVIDAIELALGQRLSGDIVRPGASKANISLGFNISNIPGAKQWLSEHELDAEGDCLIRRSISKDGRSKSFINGIPTTLAPLRELAALLINIHGQHEFQTLVKADMQRQLLDRYGKHIDLVEKLNAVFNQWQSKQKEYQELVNNSEESKSRADYLSFQLEELIQLGMTTAELEQLEQEHKQLAHAESLINSCQSSLDLLSENENAALQQLNNSSTNLQEALNINPDLKNIAELINNAIIQTEEAASELQHFLNKAELNPQRLQTIDERLGATYQLARKHRVEAKALEAFQNKLQSELDKLENHDDYLQELENALKQLESDYHKVADKLTKARNKAAKKLSQLISDNMQQLGMPGGQFKIDLVKRESNQPQLNGMEKTSYLVSANPGQALQPLQKVASGGELSRISLAVQVITTQQDNTPTLVFDEVDVGIGGATAETVGNLLRQLASNAQVLCITHLAQVAAKGHQHLQVKKAVVKGKTISALVQLNKEQRIQEIARMTGGLKITEQTIAHAKEMLLL